MNVRTVATQVGQRTSRVAYTLTVKRAYANLAYNATSQPTGGEVPTLDRKLDSLEERIQARRDALNSNTNTPSEDHARDSYTHTEVASTQESSKSPKKGIMSILPGINNASKWIKQPSVADPEFEVVSAGLGSMLHVRLPSRSELYAAPGAAVGSSGEVQSELSTASNPLKALGRRLAGGSLYFQKFSTSNVAGDVLLAPQYMSDIAAIRMDGTSEYYIRRDAFLARSPRVILQLGLAKAGLGVTNFFAHRVTGRGTLAIASYGGIYRLVLAPNEEYLVNPRHLIAWEAGSSPAATRLAIDPSQEAEPEARSSKILSNPYVASTLNIASRVAERVGNVMFGKQEFVRLQGPGDFYLCSRIRPSTEVLKQVTSSTSKLPVIFPAPVAPAPPKPTTPPNTFATVTRDGHVSITKNAPASAPASSSPSTPLSGSVPKINRQVLEHTEGSTVTKREASSS
ncbi:mitochondrial biogenesis AIM24-domain-containing protein [Gamsiella multidivaricata]|uniref:mitochondrial biogenesis AIM24-domain-containing protein n=1 Tax=Gamsiella multidivaricata TaxID=101098 RepID=UPI002220CA27|nr:mitochondrial biogenesis AIM24-domain-containing protein [Gamsiella multidivaricata]KAI7831109.1 mitochondrial biogenesis AIM24-domain-containing protein [Gamsiella multidivaricata]